MEKGLEKAGWSASTLCRNDNNGNVCRRSTGASAVYGGSNGDTIGKGGAANGAANANVTACGVTWGFRPRTELEKFNPAYIVDSAKEIEKLISSTC